MKRAWVALLALSWVGGRAAEAAQPDLDNLPGEEQRQSQDTSQGPRHEGSLKPNLGVIVGGQLLEKKDDSLSHASLVDEVTLGRTILGGLSFGIAVQKRSHLTVELVVGPYHNDVDRYCISTSPGSACPAPPGPLSVLRKTRYAVHYGFLWTYAFTRQGSGPFVGCGIGAKRYALDEPGGEHAVSTALALHGAFGFEAGAKAPFRVEARGVLIPHNPYLVNSVTRRQVELQVRLSVRVPLSK